MKREEFLQKLGQVKFWQKRDGTRAPHKPLLVLLALGRIAQGQKRLARYKEDIEHPLVNLLKYFGPSSTTIHPEYPFGRLRNDGLWEIPDGETLPATKEGDLHRSGLVERAAMGGFPEPLYNLLISDPKLVQQTAQILLNEHFPPSLHDEIRSATDLPYGFTVQETVTPSYEQDTAARTRDPAFRRNVLSAYDYRCAICGFDIRLENEPLGLEAAHIKWHSVAGPDEIPNGLALCNIHHKALDRGALGLASADKGFKVLISSRVAGQSDTSQWFLNFHNEPLRPPQSSEFKPGLQFVEWHTEWVFRDPPRSS